MSLSDIAPKEIWIRSTGNGTGGLYSTVDRSESGPCQKYIKAEDYEALRQQVSDLKAANADEYIRGVETMASALWRFEGSFREIEAHAEHNDAVLAARTKSLANADGNLNMTLSQSEIYVEHLREAGFKEAIEAVVAKVEKEGILGVDAIRALKMV